MIKSRQQIGRPTEGSECNLTAGTVLCLECQKGITESLQCRRSLDRESTQTPFECKYETLKQ